MAEYNGELIQHTIDVWSHKYGCKISEAEAVEIIHNLTRFYEVLQEIANDIRQDLDKNLINSADYKRAGEIDAIVPEKKGLYCIRLIEGSVLPTEYHRELEKRASRLIYIGKAERKTLRDRMLRQELGGKGHGTFFRSVGAMLGYLPPRGSLRDRGNQNNYKFSKADRDEIVNWINQNLEVSWIVFEGPFLFEKYLIEDYSPLLNIDYNPNRLEMLVSDRDRCRQFAR